MIVKREYRYIWIFFPQLRLRLLRRSRKQSQVPPKKKSIGLNNTPNAGYHAIVAVGPKFQGAITNFKMRAVHATQRSSSP